RAALPDMKSRAKTIEELAVNAKFYIAARPIPIDAKADKLLDPAARTLLGELAGLVGAAEWRDITLEEVTRHFAEQKGLKLGAVAQPLRIALTGSTNS